MDQMYLALNVVKLDFEIYKRMTMRQLYSFIDAHYEFNKPRQEQKEKLPEIQNLGSFLNGGI